MGKASGCERPELTEDAIPQKESKLFTQRDGSETPRRPLALSAMLLPSPLLPSPPLPELSRAAHPHVPQALGVSCCDLLGMGQDP